MSSIVGVLAELENSKLKLANAGMIRLALENNPAELYAIVINAKNSSINVELAQFGVKKVIHIALPEDQASNPDIIARAVIDTIAHFSLTSLFGLATSAGKDILPRIAALMDAPLVMDCLDVDLKKMTAKKSQYSGKTSATIRVSGGVSLFGMRPNAIKPKKNQVEIQSLEHNPGPLEEQGLSVVKIGDRSQEAKVSLAEADVIVSGGRGMKNSDNFKLLSRCAKLLKGAVGASRAAVDSGWVPYAMQIGQTGEKVSPKVYLACGISGSMQHYAGMKTAGMIIAINTDENAAIITNCDYYARSDALELIPEIIRLITRKRSQGTESAALPSL